MCDSNKINLNDVVKSSINFNRNKINLEKFDITLDIDPKIWVESKLKDDVKIILNNMISTLLFNSISKSSITLSAVYLGTSVRIEMKSELKQSQDENYENFYQQNFIRNNMICFICNALNDESHIQYKILPSIKNLIIYIVFNNQAREEYA